MICNRKIPGSKRHTPTKEFGKWLGENMKTKNMSEYQLANMIGMHVSSISKWVNGVRYPKYRTIILLCNIFDDDSDEVYRMVMLDRWRDAVESRD